MSRIIDEAKRLDDQEAAVEALLNSRRENLKRAQRELDESLSQLESCRRRKRLLVSRGVELTKKGVNTLEELERIDQQESLLTEDVHTMIHTDLLDFSFLGASSVPFAVDGSSSGGVANS